MAVAVAVVVVVVVAVLVAVVVVVVVVVAALVVVVVVVVVVVGGATRRCLSRSGSRPTATLSGPAGRVRQGWVRRRSLPIVVCPLDDGDACHEVDVDGGAAGEGAGVSIKSMQDKRRLLSGFDVIQR